MTKENKQQMMGYVYRALLVVFIAAVLFAISPEQVALRAGCGPNVCDSGFEFLHRGTPFRLGAGQVFHMSRIEALVNLKTPRKRARLEIYSHGDSHAERSYSQAVDLKEHLGGRTDIGQIDVTEDVNAPEIGAPGLPLCFREREGIPIECPDSGVTIRGTLTPPLYRVLSALQRALKL